MTIPNTFLQRLCKGKAVNLLYHKYCIFKTVRCVGGNYVGIYKDIKGRKLLWGNDSWQMTYSIGGKYHTWDLSILYFYVISNK
jgi:hypothetical protein